MSLDAHNKKNELDILIGIYDALSDVRSKVAENAVKHEMSANHISKLESKLDNIHNRIERLNVAEAQTSIKFGIITFIATLLSVTGINYALSENDGRLSALPPSKYEIVSQRGIELVDD